MNQTRRNNLKAIESHLERTAWGRGGVIQSTRGEDRIIAAWPGARPGQIRAGARKLYDAIVARMRREQKQAVRA
jgi:hypothetical protein